MHKPPSASATKPRALFLSPEAPYPAIGGGPLRSASLVEYLAQRYAVHAVVFRQPDAPDPGRAVPAGRIHRLDVMELPRHSKALAARAARNLSRLIRARPPLLDRFAGFDRALDALLGDHSYEVAIVEHFWCAPYVRQIRPHSARVILDLHNIESAWHQSLAAKMGPAHAFALRRFADASRELERRWLAEFDTILVTSSEEAGRLCGLAPRASVAVYPNALPQIPAPARQEREEIVFSGNLEYEPNVMAVRFFRDHVWPVLRERPGLQWKIVGKNPQGVRGLVAGDARIRLTGSVDDAVAELATAQVAVIPLQAGSGTRVKILEAWAAGTAVVSTPLGAEGLLARHGEHLLIAGTPESFLDAVNKLLDSPAERHRIGSAGRMLYEQCYTWPAAWEKLRGVV